jgi:hypothetical protein
MIDECRVGILFLECCVLLIFICVVAEPPPHAVLGMRVQCIWVEGLGARGAEDLLDLLDLLACWLCGVVECAGPVGLLWVYQPVAMDPVFRIQYSRGAKSKK